MDQIKKPGIISSLALLGLDVTARYLVAGPKPKLARVGAKAASRVSNETPSGHTDSHGRDANSPAKVPVQGWKVFSGGLITRSMKIGYSRSQRELSFTRCSLFFLVSPRWSHPTHFSPMQPLSMPTSECSRACYRLIPFRLCKIKSAAC